MEKSALQRLVDGSRERDKTRNHQGRSNFDHPLRCTGLNVACGGERGTRAAGNAEIGEKCYWVPVGDQDQGNGSVKE